MRDYANNSENPKMQRWGGRVFGHLPHPPDGLLEAGRYVVRERREATINNASYSNIMFSRRLSG